MQCAVQTDELTFAQLLLKILETQDLAVDYAKVAAAWRKCHHSSWDSFSSNEDIAGPSETRPTPRAIKERLAKIKENAKDPNNLAQPSPSPQKVRKPAAKSVTPKKAGGKRKRVATPTPVSTTEDEGDYLASENTPELEKLDQRVKHTNIGRDIYEEEDGSDKEC